MTNEAYDWKGRHDQAWRVPVGIEVPIVDGIKAWESYALHYERRFKSGIGTDGVLGDYWKDWGMALAHLLDGDTGTRLDSGTLSERIHGLLDEQGFGEAAR